MASQEILSETSLPYKLPKVRSY